MRRASSVLGVLLAAVAVSIVAVPRGADAAATLLGVVVKNTDANPVPTKATGTTAVSGSVSVDNLPAATPPPLWQGTPYAEYELNTDVTFEECSDFPIPAGKGLYVTHVIADFDMPAASSGTASVKITPVDGTLVRIPMPVQQGGLTGQFDGNRQDYAGELDVDLPVTAIRHQRLLHLNRWPRR